MARIKIKDLPTDKELSQDELKAVVGGALLPGSNCGISYNGGGAISNLGNNCGISYNGGGAISNLGNNCGISYNGGGAITNFNTIVK